MLGFILSKLNLLILVTAIFAIVSFFAIGLTEIAELNEAKELASRLKEKSFALAISSSYCFSDAYILPNDLTVAGEEFYYVMKISKGEIGEGSDKVNILIFSVYPRTEVKRYFRDADYAPKAIAADSFRTRADIILYSQDYSDGSYEHSLIERSDSGIWVDTGLIIDPQAVIPVNALEFIREVESGQPKLYIIACNTAFCELNKTEVGEIIHPSSGNIEGGFKC